MATLRDSELHEQSKQLKSLPAVPSKRMNDGSEAWLTASGSYYVRREPDKDNWTTIVYYGLYGEHIPLAKAECPKCHMVLESKHCGDFQACEHSFVDTDRWFPERHRYGGAVSDLQPSDSKPSTGNSKAQS